MLYLSLLLISVALWITIDLSYGRFLHLKRVSSRTFPLRQSDFHLYTYGKDLYDALFTDIKQAQHHIHILFFIVKNDKISREFLKLLIDKAQEGIEVRILLDRFGSHYLSNEAIRSLRKHGVSFSFCHKVKFPLLFFSANQRNHRKITVIDGKTGYIGGFNIGEEYLGHNEYLGLWRDYHLRLTGEGVQDLQKQFLHDWFDDTKQNLLDASLYFPKQNPGTILHQFIPTDGAYLQHTFLHLINGAKKEICIGTPYFIPGKKIMNALLKARERGVQITILVPEKADHPLVREAKFPYCRKLIQAGCNIYAFQQGFFHAKIIIVDDDICDIGTANFDMRSLYINHEINCLLYSKHFVQTVKNKFHEDLKNASILSYSDVNPTSLIDRGKEWIGTMLAFFL
ncbi:cardiolipin synthase [Bacillus thuringiensis]|uniref:Cardiolipin synthase n=1 Tax=Bacillus thuringiensis TaxID=1428 RepID=A0A9X7BY53_BACTU|nr:MULTISPECIES: cardiolipin synthase [Bacillus cereus group]ALC50238.1 cardiolipin synthetase [Bacillus cereus]MBG9613204.1 cardiolipin synthetase [Bacillus cereus]MDA1870144.1 cardiolipin synthase [Bacillus cereus]MED2877763.1 cardiolipin synthase [Bacillus thuringiensis]MYW23256.1 cardiolipin synthase [Bacillus thuringiensis]